MQRSTDAVIFDLDGTLIETTPEFRYIIAGKALAELGASASEEVIDQYWFQGNRREIIEQNCGVDYDQFIEAFFRNESPELRRQHISLYDDVDILLKMKEAGLRLGLMSSTPVATAELELAFLGEQLGISEHDLFDAIVVANRQTGIPAKPSPRGLVECLLKLGRPPDRVPYVGNADEDVIAARAIGMPDILIDRGEHKFDIEPSVGITSLYQLCDILEIGS